ncbi:MAG: hypothetical protein RL309_1690 [Verrucomicrobiota bacterium]
MKALTKTSSRITSKNANATMAVSSLPSLTNPLATAGAIGGGSSKGFGGGSGGGIGAGKGIGSGGGRNFVSLFGMKGSTGVGTGGLIGTFYDLKQTSGRQPTAMVDGRTGIAPYRAAVRDFLEAGWSPGKLSKFYKAPDTLISGQLFITGRSANDAPKAFEVEKQVKPSRWVIHYRCYVEVPSSLPFRFVGSGDDFLLVRWNRKIALDDGYETYFSGRDGNYKDFGEKVTQEYKVDRRPGGLHRLKAGPWLQVTKGTKIPVEVLIGETPGGVFDCYLAIEVAKSGTKVQGEYVGEGKLKLFRCKHRHASQRLDLQGHEGRQHGYPLALTGEVEAGAVTAEETSLLGLGQTAGVIVNETEGLLVVASKEADRPIGTIHQARRAESFENRVEVGTELLGAPGFVVGLSEHARDLAMDVRQFGQTTEL